MRRIEAFLSTSTAKPKQKSILQVAEFRYLSGASLTNALAMTGFNTVIGYQLYTLTKDPLSLGWLGLVEAIPSLSLALLGGHLADRFERRRIVVLMTLIVGLCLAGMTGLAFNRNDANLLAIYGIVFCIGLAAGFLRPASSAFEQQVIPLDHINEGNSLLSSVWLTGGITGAPLAGFSIDRLGIPLTYAWITLLLFVSAFLLSRIGPKPAPPPTEGESIWQSLREGIRFVVRSQPLVGSMALDLFAVLFGGAMALLPIFAADILHVGATGLGLLRTAPSIGSLLVMLVTARISVTHQAGRNLLIFVAGFGVSMLVFGWSTNFWLSLVALFFSGVFDGVSMVIRRIIVQRLSPEAMRGRIAAVSWLFIGASNEVGAFESGVAAKLLGTAPSVLAGGIATLLVVSVTSWILPELRKLKL
ncbi:MAG: MFS transporter [Caldilineaceae bacterium]